MARNKKKPAVTTTKVEFGYTEKPEILSKPIPELESVFSSEGHALTYDEVLEADTRIADQSGCVDDKAFVCVDFSPNLDALTEDDDTIACPADAIRRVCGDMQALLLKKNYSYGGAAFKDVRLAGMHVSAEKAILVRMSDKIRRLQEGKEFESENTIEDLAGYCLILQAVRLYKKERGEG